MTTPYSFAHNAYAADAADDLRATSPTARSPATSVNVAGRLMLLRRQGKLAFATMRDSTGEIQLFALASGDRGVRGVHASCTWATGSG